jgi:SAM-dependent methyltransferase
MINIFMNEITINNNGSHASLTWSNISELRKWSRMQLGEAYFPKSMTDREFMASFEKRIQNNWNRISSNIDVTKLKKVIDVGSGVSTTDLVASKYNPTTEFYLVDKEEFTRHTNGLYYQDVHGHYNSWTVVEDGINSSGLDRNKFNFLDPNDEWPQDVDLILSTFSWCWHYPKEVYWNKVMSSLKIGGFLLLDVLNVPDIDVVKEISKEFDSSPTVISRMKMDSHLNSFKDQLTAIDGYYGGLYLWTRNK